MAVDFEPISVPVRLTYRYSNGIAVSHNVRAVGWQRNELLVLATEKFEAGMKLSLWVPVLKRRVSCCVQSVSPSTRWTGRFEITLCLPDGVASQILLGAPEQKRPEISPEPQPAPPELSTQPAGVTLPKPTAGLKAFATETAPRDTLAAGARQLAGALEKLPEGRFWQALSTVPPSSRKLALLAAIAAVLHLLQKKGMVHVRTLFVPAKEGARKP